MTMVKASSKLWACWVTTTAIAMVIGPVGPEIWEGVPPKTEAKKPTAMAPYIPAIGPMPDAAPKAKATGNATTAVVTPPNASPRRLRKL